MDVVFDTILGPADCCFITEQGLYPPPPGVRQFDVCSTSVLWCLFSGLAPACSQKLHPFLSLMPFVCPSPKSIAPFLEAGDMQMAQALPLCWSLCLALPSVDIIDCQLGLSEWSVCRTREDVSKRHPLNNCVSTEKMNQESPPIDSKSWIDCVYVCQFKIWKGKKKAK